MCWLTSSWVARESTDEILERLRNGRQLLDEQASDAASLRQANPDVHVEASILSPRATAIVSEDNSRPKSSSSTVMARVADNPSISKAAPEHGEGNIKEESTMLIGRLDNISLQLSADCSGRDRYLAVGVDYGTTYTSSPP